jgi:hypothetical protein
VPLSAPAAPDPRRARRGGAAARAVRIGLGALLGLAVWAAEARAQFFSPGDLARPHAAFEGLDNCVKCHDQQQHESPERCLACHTELVPGISKHTGLHGRMAAQTRDQCQRCHPDHRGRDFHLIDWEGGEAKFQHAKTGYVLQGKHAQIRCEACHARPRVVVPPIARMLAADPARATFLGLSTRCESCHFDEHRGELGHECQRCHTETAWRPTPAFDHQRTAFPLRGKHAPVPCAKCHPSVSDEEPPPPSFLTPRASSFMQMKPIDHDTCASCHDDPHDGKLGPRCASCHTETSWRVISPDGGVDRAFHKRTEFPLAGAHASVPCRSCHGPFPGSPARFKGLAFARCSDCHEDAHVGQLTVTNANGRRRPDCGACHDVNAFAPPRFELEQHAQTRFPLDGAHRTTACRACHPTDLRLEALVPTAVKAKLRHERRPALLVSLAVMRPRRASKVCSGCHEDIHQGQFTAELRESDCRACHQTSSFSALVFDHDFNSRFPLTGAHRQAACASCHPREPIHLNGTPAVRYQPLPLSCAGCHADQHQGQFTWETTRAPDDTPVRRGSAQDCSFCHQTVAFKQTLFSHDDARFTSFALQGKHAQLPCDACHRTVQLAEGVRTVRYRPLPRACADCHVDFHHGDFRGFEP